MRWHPRHTVLALLMAAFFATMVSRLAISPLVPRVIDAFGVSKAAVGLAVTGMWAAYATFQLPSGLLADRFGARRVVLAGLTVAGVGGVAVTVAPAFGVLVGGAVLVGVGSGLYFPAAVGLLADRFENTAQVLGFHLGGGDLAGVVAPAAAVAVASRFGWRAGAALAPAAVAVAVVLLAWRLDTGDPASGTGAGAPGGFDLRALVGLLSRPGIAYTAALAAILMFAFQALVAFFPTFLVEQWSFSEALAGTLFSALFLTWIVFLPVSGRAADAFGTDPVVAALALSMAAGLGLLIGASATPMAFAGVFLLGMGMSWGGVVDSRFMADLPAEGRTAGYGLVRSLYVLVGSTGSVATGVLAEAAGWTPALGVSAGLLAAAALSLGANRALGLGL